MIHAEISVHRNPVPASASRRKLKLSYEVTSSTCICVRYVTSNTTIIRARRNGQFGYRVLMLPETEKEMAQWSKITASETDTDGMAWHARHVKTSQRQFGELTV